MSLLRPLASTSLALVALLSAAACPKQDRPPPVGEKERRSFTANYVDGILAPRLSAFATRATALKAAADALAASPAGVDEQAAARQAWRDAMDVWQALEMMHLGPAGSPADYTGGQGLRERIYAWPTPLVNVCAVDQQILDGAFQAEGFVDTRQANVIGLGAIEYVLFVEGDGNGCSDTASMNTGGTWAALGADEIRARRARYAAVIAADVEAKAAGLRDAWTAEGGFAAALRDAGEEGSPFSTAQQALDEIYAALFAVELKTKDKKLGLPAGMHVDCPATSCPDKAESRFSKTSKENVLRNLEAARVVFLGVDAEGNDGAGFDDLLEDRDQAALAADMEAALDGAIAAVGSFEGTIEDALATDPERVRGLYAAVKVFTDELKGTFSSVLGLRVPKEGEGDND